jgi:signal transduction histidine kinase
METTQLGLRSFFLHTRRAPKQRATLLVTAASAAILANERNALAAALPPARRKEFSDGNRLQEEFLATVCHELRGPIGAIQNAVKVLGSPKSAPIALQQQMHRLIERQTQQMAFLVGGLMDMTRIAHGQISLQRELVDLNKVLANALETLQWDFNARNHRIVLSVGETSVWLLADAARLEQVFVNLLGNASKYTDRGGKIVVSVEVSDGSAAVRISDSGIGIAPETLPHIFNLFMQAQATAPRSSSGLGIGLALVRAIVETHGGNVAAVSGGLGQGSEFTVRLPV